LAEELEHGHVDGEGGLSTLDQNKKRKQSKKQHLETSGAFVFRGRADRFMSQETFIALKEGRLSCQRCCESSFQIP